MTPKNLHDSQSEKRTTKYETNMQLVQAIVNRIDLMVTLLYEIKTGSPIGKTITILLNLYPIEISTNTKRVMQANISFATLAKLADISEIELKEALDYLQQQGIICYKPALHSEN